MALKSKHISAIVCVVLLFLCILLSMNAYYNYEEKDVLLDGDGNDPYYIKSGNVTMNDDGTFLINGTIERATEGTPNGLTTVYGLLVGLFVTALLISVIIFVAFIMSYLDD